jgi:type IV pilus assembly protein PilB
MDMGIDTFLISSTVVSVLAQRLVRVLCAECRQAYVPDKYELDVLGVRAENLEKFKFYKPVGCAHCNQMGYRGRTGVHELLLVNDMIRDAILARKTSGEIRRLAREASNLVTMREDGFYKVLKGTTSFEEVSRVVPWQELDEGFCRSPEEIIALAEESVAVSVAETEEDVSNHHTTGAALDAVHDEEHVYRIRFNTQTIAQEKEKIAGFFNTYRQMMEKMGQPLEASQLMENFIAFIIFTAERVERSLKSPFVDFSLRGKDGKIVMELETFVPRQLPLRGRGTPREKGPRLINFLMPSDKNAREGLDDEDSRFPQMGLKPEKTPELLLVEGNDVKREKTGVFQKHVETLEWKAAGGK